MTYIDPNSKPEVFHGFKIEVGPHMTTLKTPRDMDKLEVRERVIQAMDALLGITEQELI